jgi:hypothetical protein
VPRPKPRAWKPAGLDDNPVPGLYPDGMLDGLIWKHLGIARQGPRERARKQLRKVLGVLWFGLHYRGRPTGRSKLAALRGKAEPLRQFHDALRRLDADSRRLLEAQLAKNPTFIEVFPPMDWSYDEGEKVFRDNMGDVRMRSRLTCYPRLPTRSKRRERRSSPATLAGAGMMSEELLTRSGRSCERPGPLGRTLRKKSSWLSSPICLRRCAQPGF